MQTVLNMAMTASPSQLVSLSLPLPHSLDTRIYLRLSTRAKALVLCLTTATQDEGTSLKPMGSFVYALPNVSFNFHAAMHYYIPGCFAFRVALGVSCSTSILSISHT